MLGKDCRKECSLRGLSGQPFSPRHILRPLALVLFENGKESRLTELSSPPLDHTGTDEKISGSIVVVTFCLRWLSR